MFPCEMARYIAGFLAEARKSGRFAAGRPKLLGSGSECFNQFHACYRLDSTGDLGRYLETAFQLEFHLGLQVEPKHERDIAAAGGVASGRGQSLGDGFERPGVADKDPQTFL